MNTKHSKVALKHLESLAGGKLTLGNLLLSIRQGEALSQVEFAKQLGISRQNLCDIEHDRRFVSPKKASDFSLKLGYSEKQFVRLCLQNLLDRDGIHLDVEVQEAA
jgi:transcriptional regulator with XRE-family HTH domain